MALNALCTGRVLASNYGYFESARSFGAYLASLAAVLQLTIPDEDIRLRRCDL